MKKRLLLLFLFFSITVFCQPPDTISKDENRIRRKDSIIMARQKKQDSIVEALQRPDPDKKELTFNSNIDYLVKLQKEYRAKQKRTAIIRIVIGVALLAVLIIGLKRRTVKKSM